MHFLTRKINHCTPTDNETLRQEEDNVSLELPEYLYIENYTYICIFCIPLDCKEVVEMTIL